jgi:hypothetical protein
MALYSQGLNTTVTTTGAPGADIKAGSTNAPKLMELWINLGAAGSAIYGIGRPGNDGSVAQTTPVLVQPHDPADPAGLTGTAVAWTTAPTVPSIFLRRWSMGLNGGVVIWVWPRGLTIPVNKGIVMWNLATNINPTSFNVTVDE